MSVTGHNRRRRLEVAAERAEEDAFTMALTEEDKMVAELEAQGFDPELCLMDMDELTAYAAGLSDEYVVDRRKTKETIVKEIMAIEAAADEDDGNEDDVEEAKDMLLSQLDNYSPSDFGFGDGE